MMSKHLQHKNLILDFFQELNQIGSGNGLKSILTKYLATNIILNITRPYDEIIGVNNYAKDYWIPLVYSFPDIEIQPYILIGGTYEGRDYVSCTGNMVGTFMHPWHKIPSNMQATWLRFAGHFMIENGKIVKAWFFYDMLDVMRQSGYHFFPGRGLEHIPPAPMTQDGILIYSTESEKGRESLALTNSMLDALGEYDGVSLASMDQTRFWDQKNMMWYGPSGIGTTRGLKGFEIYHQVPFITAFPDRGITDKIEKDHFAQIGDGNYSCDFGFPSMYGSHLNDGWLGIKSTGKRVTFRVVDYWRREEDRLIENWVLIDIVDVLEQLGIDVFDILQNSIVKNRE